MLCTLVRWSVSDAQMLIKAKRKGNTVSGPDTMANVQTEGRLGNTLNASTHQNKKTPGDPPAALQSVYPVSKMGH